MVNHPSAAPPAETKDAPPASARAVIIGGGIMGCALAYHLAKGGWRDVVLLEKGELTSGSTWHAAGQVAHSVSDYALAKMAQYAADLYPRLEGETGQSCTWHGCGSLRVAYHKDEEDWLRHTLSVGRGIGLPMDIIGADAIRRVHPFYQLGGIRAALHTPADGHVDPAGAAFALAKGARQNGATVVRRRRVTAIKQTPSGEWRVMTEDGAIACEHLVNAGGVYARQIGQWAGLDLPIANLLHHYFVTEPVDEFKNLAAELPVVRDDKMVSGYVRMEQHSGLIGIYEKTNPTTAWDDGAPWAAENELFDADFDAVAPWLQNAFDRMPVLAASGIRRIVRGAITHPPDGQMLLGPAPGFGNFWLCCGSQVGVAWGPGAGKYLAQWMIDGGADISLRAFDPRRYGPWAGGGYRLPKGKEDYTLRHEIPYPRLDRPAARPVKTSPLYGEMKKRGAVFEQASAWERPLWFAPKGAAARHIHSFRRSAILHRIVGDECRALRASAAVADLSAFAKLEVCGRDAENFLRRTCASSIPQKNGAIVLGYFLRDGGRIELEATITRIDGEKFYLVCGADRQIAAYDFLTQRREDEQVTVNDVTDDLCVVALAGPQSRAILAKTTAAALDNDSFPWLTARTIAVAGAEALALRLSYAGELGWELHTANSAARSVYREIVKAGGGELAHAGALAFDSLRMEKGYLSGRELGDDVTPADAGIERFIAADKRPGVRRWALCYLEIANGAADANGGESVWQDGAVVGAVSSAAFGHCVGKPLAFAYLKPAAAAANGEVEVLILGEKRRARILCAAAFDPANRRPRG